MLNEQTPSRVQFDGGIPLDYLSLVYLNQISDGWIIIVELGLLNLDFT